MRGCARERLRDLDHLPPRQRQVLDQRQRMDVVGAGARQRFLGHAALRAAVDQPEAARRIADRDVVGDREVGDQRQLLEDAGDAGRMGRGRRCKRDRLAVEQHAALVGRDDARHDLDQRRLAGAVLAEDRVNAAGLDHEVGVLQRAHAAVALGDALHDEQAHSGECGDRHRDPRIGGLLVRFALPHDFLRGEIDAAGREGVADEEVVGLRGVVVGAFLQVRATRRAPAAASPTAARPCLRAPRWRS